MADYPLSITGAEIDSALGKVHSADTTPTNGSTDMVTSGGVYTAINNLSLANLAGSALVTESEGIAGNDNDTTIPTSAAVKDFVDTSLTNINPATIYVSSWRDEASPNVSSSFINVNIPYGYRASRFQVRYSSSNFNVFYFYAHTFSSRVTLYTATNTAQLPQSSWINLSSYTPASNSGNTVQGKGSSSGQFGSSKFEVLALLVECTLI